MDLLIRNLASHEAQWGFRPHLSDESPGLRVVSNDSGYPRVTIANAEGRWLRVHSDRAPLEEAARWLDTIPHDPPAASTLWIVGAGLGYVLDVLASRDDRDRTCVLLEPEPALLREALMRRDWSDRIARGRLMLLAGPRFEGCADAWRAVQADEESPVILAHPVLAMARQSASTQALHIVRQAVSGARANREAKRRFGGRYLLNTLSNLPTIAQAGHVGTLARTASGRPAIVAAAGPSLNRNLSELADVPNWRERAVLVAVDTALKPCLAAGLVPHYVVAVDPGETNARKLVELSAVSETALVAEPSIDPRSFAAFDGRTFLFKVSETHAPWPWLKAHGLDVPRLRAWGSVLTTAFDFALTLACDPVIFIGADLAYTNGQPHCRNTMYEKDWHDLIETDRRATLEVIWQYSIPDSIPAIDLHGAEARTSESLVAFRDWIVAQTTSTPAVRFFNATGAGILHGPNITATTVGAVLAGAAVRRATEPSPPVHAIQDHWRAARLRSALDASPLTASPSGIPFEDWRAFTAHTVAIEDLRSALINAVGTVAR